MWKVLLALGLFTFSHNQFTSQALADESVHLSAIESAASSFTSRHHGLELMYRNALVNTEKQLAIAVDQTAYVKTGDIPAEWLRDSSAQVRPYLFFARDPQVALLLKAVIQRQAKMLVVDPYANAFREDYSVWERKFELDSLAYPILLAWTYWKVTGDASVFTPEVRAGLAQALATMETEQDHSGERPPYLASTYKFVRGNEISGKNPVGYTGMIWTGFRPSDDTCTYNFLIPAEMMAVQALGALSEIESTIYRDEPTAARAGKLRTEVHEGIQRFAVVRDPKHRSRHIYAYEVDGLGHANLMDDGNLPSLLSAPYFGYVQSSDPIYRNTREFVLSPENPYYYSGKLARGVGSPHTPKNMVWPLALLSEGLTTSAQPERRQVLHMLLASDPGDHQLHESFDPSHPKHFTRPDFGWPNALFVEFLMTGFQGASPLPVPSISDL